MDKPAWIFWKEWQEEGKDFPPPCSHCPRCGEYMMGGFWMHLCPDTVEYIRKNQQNQENK